jgi:hypothetical protein
MALTCLQIIQRVCTRIGITSPNVAFASQDPQIQQLLEISNEEGQDLADRYQWQALQLEALFTTVATQIQGAMSTIAPGCKWVVNETIWDRTLRRPVYGPRSLQDWQEAKAIAINGPFSSYRIINDSINFYPTPAAGDSCAFEYITKNWISTSTASSSDVWTNDADTPRLDDQLIILGTIWRWKQIKGLDYAEDYAKYERRVTNAISHDGGKPILYMDGAPQEIIPGIFVPAGSWPV